MRSATRFLLFFSLFISIHQVEAKIQWDEPEVVPEKLVRKNRRVMRFAGQTNPYSLIRIRKNRLKLYLDTGRVRWAQIPKKNRGQFPVRADNQGFFTFDLYLPTIAVEIPIEIKVGKKWKPYNLNFRVPDEGKADNFKALEDSFRPQEEGDLSGIEQDDNYYSRKNDKGLMVSDRDGKQAYEDSKIQAWGGLGISYFDTAVEITGQSVALSTSGGTVVIPSFAFGLDWEINTKYRFKGAVRSSSGSVDGVGGGPVSGRDFNWLQGQTSLVWFQAPRKQRKRWGFDFGLQLQQLPYFRERPGVANLTFFDNNTYNVHIGMLYENRKPRGWAYEMYGRYLYPFSSGDTFDIESSFPLFFEFGGGIKKPLTQGLAIGIFGQLNYFSTDVSYSDPIDGGRDSSLDLFLFTVDVRLIANF